MGRKKLLKIVDFNEMPNCINADVALKGSWKTQFGNNNPIVLELGCGKGDLSVGLAMLHPELNFIGADIKGVRMWTGARSATEQGLTNVAFLRCDIIAIGDYFEPGEIAGIWITFPDPFPKLKQTKKRMINEIFLRMYAGILADGGRVWFKTDNNTLFEYALEHFGELNEKGVFQIEVREQTRDLHASSLKNPDNGITTDYERRFMKMGKAISYMSFSLKAGPNIGMIPATERVALDPAEKAPRLR